MSSYRLVIIDFWLTKILPLTPQLNYLFTPYFTLLMIHKLIFNNL